MKKIVRQSGPHSSEGAIVGLEAPGESSKSCDNGYMVRKRCNDLKKTFFRNFRTIEGECNNEETPSLGSARSTLSRLLPAEHLKFNKSTYFKIPKGTFIQGYLLLTVIGEGYYMSFTERIIILITILLFQLHMISTVVAYVKKNRKPFLILEL